MQVFILSYILKAESVFLKDYSLESRNYWEQCFIPHLWLGDLVHLLTANSANLPIVGKSNWNICLDIGE